VTNDALARMDALMLPRFKAQGMADAARYWPLGKGTSIPCDSVLIDRNVQYQGDGDIGAMSVGTLLTAYHSDIGPGVPDIKSFFTIGGETFVVDRVQDNDESRCVLVVVLKDCC
jgi:hypothetical protein